MMHTEKLEALRVVTPLGIRFWDSALNAQVSNGLVVRAHPAEDDQHVVTAAPTFSGIYAFHHLPGLHGVEYPNEFSGHMFASPPITRPFIIQVVDHQQRFLPVVFRVTAPFQGVFPTGLESVGIRLPGFFLFSAPTRPVLPSLAVVRSQLMVKSGLSLMPAAYAMLEIHTPQNQVWHGVADEQGRVMVIFPYPVFTSVPVGVSSPPAPFVPPQWELRVRVRYDPAQLVWLSGASWPELSSILRQPAAKLWLDRGTQVDQSEVQLRFDEELVLRTAEKSTLLISPAV